MDDVLVPCGGYLLVQIDPWGYVRRGGRSEHVVHRETRNLHLGSVFPSLEEAKKERQGDDIAILELTSEGGGAAIWMREDQREQLVPRLSRFRSCYGNWPVHMLSI